MILYNVTVNVYPDIEEKWFKWMKDLHMNEVMATGYFIESKIFKLLNEDPDAEGNTYAIQYFSSNLDQLNTYFEKEASRLRKDHISRFGDKVLTFRTILEEV